MSRRKGSGESVEYRRRVIGDAKEECNFSLPIAKSLLGREERRDGQNGKRAGTLVEPGIPFRQQNRACSAVILVTPLSLCCWLSVCT